MAELVQFVWADGLFAGAGEEPFHVGGRGGEERETGAGERDFGCAGEDESAIGISGGGAGVENIGECGRIGVEVMQGVGVVPEDAEIDGAGFHGGETANGFVGIDFAGGIGIFRDTPDGFDGWVGDEGFDFVHVRAAAGERDGDHADAEVFADSEVAIVTGNRSEKSGSGRGLRPGRGGTGNAFEEGPDERVVHEGEAGIIGDDDLVGGSAEHVGEERANLGEALEVAVVAGVFFGGGDVVAVGESEEFVGDVELFGGGLAAGHVEGEFFGAELFVFGAEAG